MNSRYFVCLYRLIVVDYNNIVLPVLISYFHFGLTLLPDAILFVIVEHSFLFVLILRIVIIMIVVVDYAIFGFLFELFLTYFYRLIAFCFYYSCIVWRLARFLHVLLQLVHLNMELTLYLIHCYILFHQPTVDF